MTEASLEVLQEELVKLRREITNRQREARHEKLKRMIGRFYKDSSLKTPTYACVRELHPDESGIAYAFTFWWYDTPGGEYHITPFNEFRGREEWVEIGREEYWGALEKMKAEIFRPFIMIERVVDDE